MEEEWNSMPEDTEDQIIDKIEAIIWNIRSDWNDPRYECRAAAELCEKIRKLKKDKIKQNGSGD